MEPRRISACSCPIRTEPIEVIFRTISSAGFSKLDLWGGPPNYSNDPSRCDVERLKRSAAEHGLTIANLGTYPGKTLHENGLEPELAELRWAVDNAARLGARSIRVCPGTGEDPAIIPALLPFFREAAAYAGARGVYLRMENHRGSIASTPEHVMPLIREIGSPFLGILYDPANLMGCRVDYRAAYRQFRTHVVHVHVKDSRWVDGVYERTMLGQGDIDLAWLVESLESDGYAGDYALEYELERDVPVGESLCEWLSLFRAL